MQQTVYVEEKLSCYDIKLNEGWAKAIFKASEPNKRLKEASFALVASLRSLAHLSRLPHESVMALKSYHKGMVERASDFSAAGKVARTVAFRIARETPDLTAEQMVKMQGIATDTANKLQQVSSASMLQFDEEEFFRQMVYGKSRQMAMTLWAIGRQCYVGAYSAYETYVSACLGAAVDQEPFTRWRPQEFEKKIEKVLGPNVLKACWLSPDMRAARAIRNVLVHAGGKAKEGAIPKEVPSELISHGEIQVSISHFVALKKVIQRNARMVADATCEAKKRPAHE